jgi:hypothetical protein
MDHRTFLFHSLCNVKSVFMIRAALLSNRGAEAGNVAFYCKVDSILGLLQSTA